MGITGYVWVLVNEYNQLVNVFENEQVCKEAAEMYARAYPSNTFNYYQTYVYRHWSF